MKIERLVIRNFRGFDNFALDLGGRSHFLIGQNAGGKSSLLTAIVRALGRDLSFTRADFRDTGQPIEIEVALSDFTVPERGLYGDYIRFGPPARLVVGVRVVWNVAAEEAEYEHHYPLHAGSHSRREEREGFPMQWFPSWRDPSRMLQFGAPRSVMGRLLAALPLTSSLDQAATDIQQAGEQLARDPALVTLLDDAQPRTDLAGDLRQAERRRSANSARWNNLASDISASSARTASGKEMANFVVVLGADLGRPRNPRSGSTGNYLNEGQ